MSRTHKTAPWTVRVMSKNYLIEHHDHRNGICDLPPRPVGMASRRGWRFGNCTWEGSTTFWSTPYSACGIYGCSERDERKVRHRKSRREGRRIAMRDLLEAGER